MSSERPRRHWRAALAAWLTIVPIVPVVAVATPLLFTAYFSVYFSLVAAAVLALCLPVTWRTSQLLGGRIGHFRTFDVVLVGVVVVVGAVLWVWMVSEIEDPDVAQMVWVGLSASWVATVTAGGVLMCRSLADRDR